MTTRTTTKLIKVKKKPLVPESSTIMAQCSCHGVGIGHKSQSQSQNESQLKSVYQSIIKDEVWWLQYYDRTKDYSVGPAVTLFADPKRNLPMYQKTTSIYQKLHS